MKRTPVPVAIVGAGPVGLALALGLARAGVRSLVVEQRAEPSGTSRAAGIHVRTREIFRQWGVEERFLAEGTLLRRLTLHSAAARERPLLSLDFTELDGEADRPGLLLLEQDRTEALLLEAVRASGLCDVQFGAEAVELEQDAAGARLTVRVDGAERTVSTGFVVGCDGAGSYVRGALGLPFEGATYALRPLLADVHVRGARDRLPWPRLCNGRDGFTFALHLPGGLWRVVDLQRGEPAAGEEVAAADVHAAVARVLGAGPAEVAWASRFRIHIRASPRFRVGRVLLAGDAAHVHSPAWGFGMNGGIQDAHNLAWKLAAALDGGDVDRLLDSYDVERRAVVVENVSRFTDRLTRLFLGAPARFRQAAVFLIRQLLRSGRARRAALKRGTMLDLDYPASPLLDAGERAAGARLPNPVLRAPDGAKLRLYDLLPCAPVILEVAEAQPLAAALPASHVIRVGTATDAYREPAGVLRALLGGHDGWILVRPDAHVAWARRSAEGMAATGAAAGTRSGRQTS